MENEEEKAHGIGKKKALSVAVESVNLDQFEFTIFLIIVFLFYSEVEGIYVITSGVPDEPKVTDNVLLFAYVKVLDHYCC